MAAKKSCEACSELQENSAEFVLNGVTENVHNALMNNDGFNTASDNDDCADLNNANDCLIGNMEDEVDAYEVCDWKEFMPDFIHNVWTVIKAVISAICGLWKRVSRHECELNLVINGTTFNVGEDETDGSYVVAGKGVSFLERSSSDTHSTDVRIVYIGGALCYIAGGLVFHQAHFTEPDNIKVWNFDEGGSIRHSYNRDGNGYWVTTGSNSHAGDTVSGNELVYEIRIKKSQYPQIKQLIGLFGQDSNVGGFHVRVQVFNEGAWAYGQHGSCNSNGGGEDGHDAGHKVPAGWIYVQMRMSYIWDLVHDNADHDNSRGVTPIAILGARFNKDNITC